ncbi:MAG: hypothetical protein AAFO29_24725, partial [Actinomycetota bacterium]
MFTRTGRRTVLPLLAAIALLAASCGGESTDDAASTDEIVTDEAATDGDTTDGDATDGDTTDGESTDGESTDGDTDDGATDPAADGDAGADDGETAEAAGTTSGTGLDTSLFLDGALAGEPTVEPCTLSDGSTSECYTVTVVGTPIDQAVGPFCPNSITDGEEAGGLWLDGEDSYTIDGEFFTELAEIYGDELWDNIYNDDGSINVIDDAESFQVAARPDITEEYYYHCVDGDVTWTNAGGQIEHTVQIPVTPTLTGAATVEFAEGAHSTLGVTLNGAMLAGSADMAAILSSYTIAAFDDCGGHINPALGYHFHGTAGCSDITEAG